MVDINLEHLALAIVDWANGNNIIAYYSIAWQCLRSDPNFYIDIGPVKLYFDLFELHLNKTEFIYIAEKDQRVYIYIYLFYPSCMLQLHLWDVRSRPITARHIVQAICHPAPKPLPAKLCQRLRCQVPQSLGFFMPRSPLVVCLGIAMVHLWWM